MPKEPDAKTITLFARSDDLLARSREVQDRAAALSHNLSRLFDEVERWKRAARQDAPSRRGSQLPDATDPGDPGPPHD